MYVWMNRIFECFYMFFGWQRGHPLITYATGGTVGSSRMHKAAYMGREVSRLMCTFALKLSLFMFWQHFCLMVSCFICRNVILPSFKKDLLIRNGYFPPTISVSMVIILLHFLILFFRTKLGQNVFNCNKIES